MSNFYGYLHVGHSPDTPLGLKADDVESVFNQTDSFHNLTEREYRAYDFPKQRNWELRRFISPIALMGEPMDMVPGPYAYQFCTFRNPLTGNVLIAAARYKVVNEIVRRINTHLKRNLLRFSIDVHSIIETLTAQNRVDGEKTWFVTSLHLDVNSYGSKLETLSLNGSDVVGSGFLNGFGPSDVTVRQIGLRIHSSGLESARITNSGAIQLYSDRLRDLEQCLGLVKDVGGFVPPL